jgi:hypothetical protein
VKLGYATASANCVCKKYGLFSESDALEVSKLPTKLSDKIIEIGSAIKDTTIFSFNFENRDLIRFINRTSMPKNINEIPKLYISDILLL